MSRTPLLLALLLIGGVLPALVSLPVSAASYPNIINTTTGSNSGSSTTQTYRLPTGATVGDIFIECIGYSTPPGATTWPSGWVSLFPASASYLECQYRVYNRTDTTVFTVTSVNAVVSMWTGYLIRGARTDSIPEAAANAATATNANPDPPALTVTTTENRLTIATAAWAGGAAFSAYPAGYTLGQLSTIRVFMAAADNGTASINPTIATIASSQIWYAETISIRPAIVPTLVIDYTPLWVIFAVFLVLLGLGLLVHPIFQFMAGLAGLALTFELFTLTSDTFLATITAFMAIAVLITSIFRDWR